MSVRSPVKKQRRTDMDSGFRAHLDPMSLAGQEAAVAELLAEIGTFNGNSPSKYERELPPHLQQFKDDLEATEHGKIVLPLVRQLSPRSLRKIQKMSTPSESDVEKAEAYAREVTSQSVKNLYAAMDKKRKVNLGESSSSSSFTHSPSASRLTAIASEKSTSPAHVSYDSTSYYTNIEKNKARKAEMEAKLQAAIEASGMAMPSSSISTTYVSPSPPRSRNHSPMQGSRANESHKRPGAISPLQSPPHSSSSISKKNVQNANQPPLLSSNSVGKNIDISYIDERLDSRNTRRDELVASLPVHRKKSDLLSPLEVQVDDRVSTPKKDDEKKKLEKTDGKWNGRSPPGRLPRHPVDPLVPQSPSKSDISMKKKGGHSAELGALTQDVKGSILSSLSSSSLLSSQSFIPASGTKYPHPQPPSPSVLPTTTSSSTSHFSPSPSPPPPSQLIQKSNSLSKGSSIIASSSHLSNLPNPLSPLPASPLRQSLDDMQRDKEEIERNSLVRKAALNSLKTAVFNELKIDLDPSFTKRRLFGKAASVLTYFVYVWKVRSCIVWWTAQTKKETLRLQRLGGFLLVRVARGMLGRRKAARRRFEIEQMLKRRFEEEQAALREANWKAARLAACIRRGLWSFRQRRKRKQAKACTIIQARWRGVHTRDIMKDKLAEARLRRKAARRIQTAFRRHLAQRYVQVLRKIIAVSKWLVGKKQIQEARKIEMRREGSAYVIARYFRAYRTKHCLHRYLHWNRVEMCVKIQTTYRGYRERKRLQKIIRMVRANAKHRYDSAAKIQSCYRGFKFRRVVAKLKEERHRYKNELKAMKRKLMQHRDYFVISRYYLRMMYPRKHLIRKRYATKIQAVVRAFLSRKHSFILMSRAAWNKWGDLQRRKMQAALRIQKHWRGYWSRLAALKKKRNISALTIQCSFRQYRARMARIYLQRVASANRVISRSLRYLYKSRRSRLRRLENNRLGVFAIRIQRLGRKYIGRQLLQRQKHSVRSWHENAVAATDRMNKMLSLIQLKILQESLETPLGKQIYSYGKWRMKKALQQNGGVQAAGKGNALDGGGGGGGGGGEKNEGDELEMGSCPCGGVLQGLFVYARGINAKVEPFSAIPTNRLEVKALMKLLARTDGLLIGGRLADKSFKEFKDKEEIARDREARERGGSRAGSRGNDTNTSSSFSAKKAPPHAIIGKGSTTGSQSNANRGTVRGQTDCALFDSLISGYIAIPGVGKTFSATELDIILNSLPCKASDKGAGLSWQGFHELLEALGEGHFAQISLLEALAMATKEEREENNESGEVRGSPPSGHRSSVMFGAAGLNFDGFGMEVQNGRRTSSKMAMSSGGGMKPQMSRSRMVGGPLGVGLGRGGDSNSNNTPFGANAGPKSGLSQSAMRELGNSKFASSLFTPRQVLGGTKPNKKLAMAIKILFCLNLQDEAYIRPVIQWLEDESRERLGQYATMIQLRYRARKSKFWAQLELNIQRAKRALEEQSSVVVIIQKYVRRFICIRRQAHVAQKFIIKYCPFDSPAYWYNPSTRVSSLTKPKILRQFEACVIRLPPQGLACVITCPHCSTSPVQVNCNECEDSYCKSCFFTLHCKGHMKLHRFHLIPYCSNCRFQVASKSCLTCVLKKPDVGSLQEAMKESERGTFCDTCFVLFHDTDADKKKNSYNDPHNVYLGRTKESYLAAQLIYTFPPTTHHYESTTQCCEECSFRMASWRCKDCDQVYCHTCLTVLHSIGGAFASHSADQLPYYTREMHKSHARAVKDKRMHKKLEAAKKAVAIQREIFRNQSIVRIQAWWRGIRGRYEGRKYMRMMRRRQRIAWRERRREDRDIRNTLSYQMQDFFGMAPALHSDTREESILKKLGHWSRPRAREYIYKNLDDWGFYKFRGHTNKKGVPKTGFDVGTEEELLEQAQSGGIRLPGLVILKKGKNVHKTTTDWNGIVNPGEMIRFENRFFYVKEVGEPGDCTVTFERKWTVQDVRKGARAYRVPTYTEENFISRMYYQFSYRSYSVLISNPLCITYFQLHASFFRRLSRFGQRMMLHEQKNGDLAEVKSWKRYMDRNAKRAQWAENYLVDGGAPGPVQMSGDKAPEIHKMKAPPPAAEPTPAEEESAALLALATSEGGDESGAGAGGAGAAGGKSVSKKKTQKSKTKANAREAEMMEAALKARVAGQKWVPIQTEVEERRAREEAMDPIELAKLADDWIEEMDPMTGNIYWYHKDTLELSYGEPFALSTRKRLEEEEKEKKAYKETLLAKAADVAKRQNEKVKLGGAKKRR